MNAMDGLMKASDSYESWSDVAVAVLFWVGAIGDLVWALLGMPGVDTD